MDTDTRGTTYLGSWVANQMHELILEMSDGYMYNGTFVYGACTSQAKSGTQSLGATRSEPATYGEMVNGARQGMGTYHTAISEWYIGAGGVQRLVGTTRCQKTVIVHMAPKPR